MILLTATFVGLRRAKISSLIRRGEQRWVRLMRRGEQGCKDHCSEQDRRYDKSSFQVPWCPPRKTRLHRAANEQAPTNPKRGESPIGM